MRAMVSGVWRGSVTVLLALNGRDFPDDDEWDEYLERARALLDADPDAPLRPLSFSDGGGPTGAQRRRIVELVGGRPVRGCLVTTSRLARSIGAIFSLIDPGFRVLGPDDLRRALAHVGVPPVEVPALMSVVRAADAGLGLRCLRELPSAVVARE